MAEYKEISTICPNLRCDKDIVLDAARIKRAILRKGQLEGKALIGCPECGCAMIIPDEVPSDDKLFEQWAVNAAEEANSLECVGFLDPTTLTIPGGHQIVAGETIYTPGNGGPALDKYHYMLKYGRDPSIIIYKTKQKPFVVGEAGK